MNHLVARSLAALLFLLPLPGLDATAKAGNLTALTTRPSAPDFELIDIGGETHRLSSLKGKVVLLNFWASWCAPCRAEMPSLQRLLQLIGNEEFVILAVNLGESKEDIARFYFSINPPLTFTLLMDSDLAASQYWPVQGLPATFLLDRAGRVSHVSHGARRWDSDDAVIAIRRLLDPENQV